MKTFKQYLNEMPIAGLGDWKGSNKFQSSISKTVVDLYWRKVGKIQEFEVRELSNRDSFVVGSFNDTEFRVAAQIELRRESEIGNDLKMPNLFSVEGVITDLNLRGRGIGKELYQFLLSRGYIILGDSVQYFGARKLWAKISRDSRLIVDVVDIMSSRVVMTDVELKHGDLDHEFDASIWSYDLDKAQLRPILRKLFNDG